MMGTYTGERTTIYGIRYIKHPKSYMIGRVVEYLKLSSAQEAEERINKRSGFLVELVTSQVTFSSWKPVTH
jgi:hypothetical protein